MKIAALQNKKILIVGYGIEGKATEQFLHHTFSNSNITVADKTEGEQYLTQQKKYDLAIKSPGVQTNTLTIPYTTATNIFFANVKGKTIGVTGTKGKSTTASLIYHLCKVAGKNVHLVGNITHKLDAIGEPMLQALDKTNTADDIWVIELSSQQLDDCTYSPHIAVMTSFFPEHMDFHGSIENYLLAKSVITKYQTPDDYFIYNEQFAALRQLAHKTKAHAVPFIENLPFPTTSIPLLGKHNISNVQAAVTVATILGIPVADITTAISSFTPLPHRLEIVGTVNDITFVDDAISTTPESTMQAIESFTTVGTLFLGGKDRGYDFDALAKLIIAKQIPNLVLFPDSGETILTAIQKLSATYMPTIVKTTDMQAAVAFAYANSPTHSTALLSTASPSYSVWKNFEEKGNLFKEEVKKLTNS